MKNPTVSKRNRAFPAFCAAAFALTAIAGCTNAEAVSELAVEPYSLTMQAGTRNAERSAEDKKRKRSAFKTFCYTSDPEPAPSEAVRRLVAQMDGEYGSGGGGSGGC